MTDAPEASLIHSIELIWAGCSKIAEAEAAVSVNEKMWLVMHMHVQLKLDERFGLVVGPPAVSSSAPSRQHV